MLPEASVKNWFKVFFLFFILGLLLFSISFKNDFLIDDFVFLNNPVLSGPQFASSQWNPYREQALGVNDSNEIQYYYRPLQNILMDYCYSIFKTNLWKYHLLNLVFFVLASSLIYLFVEKITGNFIFALLAGFFYLIHPINGIIVNYISASVFALQVIFVLGAILLFWESLERNKDRGLYFLSVLLVFFSLFWHESGVMIPIYISAVLLCRKDTFKDKALYLLPYFLIIFSYLVFRSLFLNLNVSALTAHLNMTGLEYPANLFQVFMWYISRLFYPQGIVMAWATPILHGHIFWYALGGCLLPILFLLLFIQLAKAKILQMAIAWIVTGFAPVCLAAFMAPENGVQIEPHWFVISSIGFFIFAAHYCLVLLDHTKKGGLALIFILTFVWASVSYANNQLWVDEKTYALYWSKIVPTIKLPYFYLAESYQREGNLEESRKYYKMALSDDQSYIGIYNNLGNIDEAEGRLKDAESDYKKVLTVDPYYGAIYNNLGTIYSQEKRLDKAEESYNRSLRLDPLQIEPRLNLAFILLKHSEYQKAVDLSLQNLGIVNDDTKTLFLLSYIFMLNKNLSSLKKYVYRYVNVETNPTVLKNFGDMLSHHHAPDLARECFKKAEQLRQSTGR